MIQVKYKPQGSERALDMEFPLDNTLLPKKKRISSYNPGETILRQAFDRPELTMSITLVRKD